MTAAVGSAAPGGVEKLLQSGAGKVAGSGHRNHVKQSEDIKSQPDGTHQQADAAEVDDSGTAIDQTEKTSRRKHGKSNSDDDDTSFEDTFDSIGQDGSKDDGKKADRPQIVLPNLATMQQLATSTPTDGSDADQKLQAKPQSAVRPANFLRQASILALMDAKDRIFANVRDMTAADTKAGQAPPQTDNDTTEVVTPITIDRRETHWNFDNKVVTTAALQASALQTDAHNVTQAAAALGAATTTSSKAQTTDTASLTAKPNQTAPQAAAIPDVEPPASPSFGNSGGDPGNSDQRGAQLQSQASADPTGRKIGKAEPSASIDQIFTANANPPQTPSSATDQVRNGIIDGLSAGTVDPTANTSSQVPSSRPTAVPVLRTLDLTLSPEDLGSVKLRLSLKSNSLSIEAEASKASTAKLLNDDRVSLERGLRDAGYDVSSMKVTDASASNSANPNGWQMGGSPSRDGDQARPSFAGGQGGEMQRRDGSTFNQSQHRPKESNQQTAAVDLSNGRPGNAVYI